MLLESLWCICRGSFCNEGSAQAAFLTNAGRTRIGVCELKTCRTLSSHFAGSVTLTVVIGISLCFIRRHFDNSKSRRRFAGGLVFDELLQIKSRKPVRVSLSYAFGETIKEFRQIRYNCNPRTLRKINFHNQRCFHHPCCPCRCIAPR